MNWHQLAGDSQWSSAGSDRGVCVCVCVCVSISVCGVNRKRQREAKGWISSFLLRLPSVTLLTVFFFYLCLFPSPPPPPPHHLHHHRRHLPALNHHSPHIDFPLCLRRRPTFPLSSPLSALMKGDCEFHFFRADVFFLLSFSLSLSFFKVAVIKARVHIPKARNSFASVAFSFLEKGKKKKKKNHALNM